MKDLASNLMITTETIPKTRRKRVLAILSYALDTCEARSYDVK
jgi:hypothetical protein